MTANNPIAQRRKQSIGTLQVTDSTTANHPNWSRQTPQVGQSPEIDEIVPIRDDASNIQGTNGISPRSSRYKSIESPDEQGHNDSEHDSSETDNQNGTDKNVNAVQFSKQMSYLSSLSQVTLQLTFKERYLSWRYAVDLLMLSAFFISILMRNCMPIALVCMADPSHQDGDSDKQLNRTSKPVVSSGQMATNGSELRYEFSWDLNTQSLILSAVQFSSCIGPLVCDLLRNRLGSKHALNICMLLGTALTFLTPVGARLSPWVLFTIRVLLGIAMGANVTTTADILSWWSPASEKQTMTSCAFAGVNLGAFFCSIAAGFICSIPINNGWPFIFYIFGFLSLMWVIASRFFLADKPETHPYISDNECSIIVNYRSPINAGPTNKPEKPPYKKIFSSTPVLAFIISSCSQVWSTGLYFTYLPNFFVTVHKFTVEETGVLMSLVAVARFLGIPIWTMIINKLRRKNVDKTKVKKFVLCVGYGMSSICQGIIMFLDSRYRWVTLALFLIVLMGQAAGLCVYTVLPLDMAPRYAGFLSGVFYSLGSLVSISGPLMVAALTPNGTLAEWRIVWIIVICVFVLGALIFLVFGDSTIQPWARVHRDSRPNIQSPFVAMGRRMSAALDNPITPVSAVPGDGPFRLATQLGGISMSPNGPPETQSNQDIPPPKPKLATDRHHLPQEGVVNVGFQPDGQEPEMVDRVSSPGIPENIQEPDVFDLDDLKFIDELDDSKIPAEEKARADLTKL